MQRIDAFPQGEDCWRVAWFGDIQYQRHTRYDQPFIRTVLSRVSVRAFGSRFFVEPLDPPEEQTEVVIPVGMLALLTIGSIWRNGELVARPENSTELFAISGKQSSAPIITAGAAYEDGGFILPFGDHPYHRAHTRSYCVRAQVDGGVNIIFPVPELIRFYFGSSSGLLSRLFTGPFNETRLWSRAEKLGRGRGSIDLSLGISGASASDVARIAFDQCAMYAAKMISSSLMAPTDGDAKRYPKMPFPFIGDSNLGVSGQWIASSNRKTFLVFQVLSCSHRFPFSSLKYSMGDKKTSSIPGESSQKQSRSIAYKTKSSRRETLVNEAPDTAMTPKKSEFVFASRFPDLNGKLVSRVDSNSPARFLVSETGETVAASSVGSGGGRSGVRPVELVMANEIRQQKPHPIEQSEFGRFVDEVVQDLVKKGNQVAFIPLDRRQRLPQYSVMPEVILDGGEIHTLSYIEVNGKSRSRYVSVIRVNGINDRTSEAIWLILEAQKEPPTSAQKDLVLKCSVEKGEHISAGWVAGRIHRETHGDS